MLDDLIKSLATAIGAAAAIIGTFLGLKNFLDRKKKEKREFYNSLATKEQMERHEVIEQQQLTLLREELIRRQDQIDERVGRIEQSLTDLPLRLVEALKDSK